MDSDNLNGGETGEAIGTSWTCLFNSLVFLGVFFWGGGLNILNILPSFILTINEMQNPPLDVNKSHKITH